MAKKFLTPITPPALANDPSISPAGSIYYNTTDSVLKISNGTIWETLTGGGGGSSSASSIQALDTAPSSPSMGSVYFDTSENTIKAYDGYVWYDVAGPKELLDHQHYAGDGFVKYALYGGYVDNSDLVFVDGGTSSISTFNDTIDGGNS